MQYSAPYRHLEQRVRHPVDYKAEVRLSAGCVDHDEIVIELERGERIAQRRGGSAIAMPVLDGAEE